MSQLNIYYLAYFQVYTNAKGSVAGPTGITDAFLHLLDRFTMGIGIARSIALGNKGDFVPG